MNRIEEPEHTGAPVTINIFGAPEVDASEVAAAISRRRRHPISLAMKPARAHALTEVAEVIGGWHLYREVGCEGRATLVVVDKLTRFLKDLLGTSVVIDDEDGLGLADDQRAENIPLLSLQSRVVVRRSLIAAENVVEVLRELLASNAVNAEPVPVDDDLGHKTSPSVGAPNGAVCDNPNPTDGESPSGAAAPSPAAAAPDSKTK